MKKEESGESNWDTYGFVGTEDERSSRRGEGGARGWPRKTTVNRNGGNLADVLGKQTGEKWRELGEKVWVASGRFVVEDGKSGVEYLISEVVGGEMSEVKPGVLGENV